MSTITISPKINKKAKTVIAQLVSEILSDPDFGLELSDKAKKRLLDADKRRTKTITFDEIEKKYY